MKDLYKGPPPKEAVDTVTALKVQIDELYFDSLEESPEIIDTGTELANRLVEIGAGFKGVPKAYEEGFDRTKLDAIRGLAIHVLISYRDDITEESFLELLHLTAYIHRNFAEEDQ